SNKFTWTAVIKPYDLEKDMMFMYGSTTAQYFRVQNGKLGASVQGENSPVAYTLTEFRLSDKIPSHVCFVHDNGSYKIYANGELVGESDRGKAGQIYRLSWIGQYTLNDPRSFIGEINSVLSYNRALTPEEIAHNYKVE